MTLSVRVWLIHGIPFCYVWYVITWPLCICMISLVLAYVFCFAGSVWMHPKYFVLCRVIVSVCLTLLSHLGLRGLPSSCTYDLTDMWLCDTRHIRVSLVGRLVAFLYVPMCLFLVSRLDKPLFYMIIWFWLLYDSYYHLILHILHSFDLWYLFSWSLVAHSFERRYSFHQELMISFSMFLYMLWLFDLLYICSLGFLSSATFLFMRQVLGWKLGLSE
jgi:hypothetical protein